MKKDNLTVKLRCQLELMNPGEQLPTERELALAHGVSYSTLRRATDQLCRDGYLKKIRGKGTFVLRADKKKPQLQGTVIYADPWEINGNAYFTRCLQGIVESIGEHGLQLRIFRLLPKSQDALLEAVAESGAVGLLVPWLPKQFTKRLRLECPGLRIVSTGERFPPAGISSVMLDHQAIGFKAASYLLRDCGVQRPLLLAFNQQSIDSFNNYVANFIRLDKEKQKQIRAETIQIFRESEFDPAAILRQLKGLKGIDGIAFDDDRLAAACIPSLPAGLPVISTANAGENILPPNVARLVTDSFEIGTGAVQLLCRMLKEQRSITVTTLIQPRLELPVNVTVNGL